MAFSDLLFSEYIIKKTKQKKTKHLSKELKKWQKCGKINQTSVNRHNLVQLLVSKDQSELDVCVF